jgi:CRP-like cAMP-binding protein
MTVAAPALEIRCALFEGISRADQAKIFADAKLRKYAPGDLILHHGARAEHFFLMYTGCARFFLVSQSGKKLPLLWAMPGDIIGGMGVVLHQRSYLLSCEAVRTSQVFIWNREVIRKHFMRLPRMLDSGMQIATGYVEWLLSQHVSLTCDSARERLAKALTEYARAIGEPCSNGVRIDATNEELAHAANITKYTACRLLAEWQKSGAIAKVRGKTILTDPKRLV